MKIRLGAGQTKGRFSGVGRDAGFIVARIAETLPALADKKGIPKPSTSPSERAARRCDVRPE